MKKAVFALGALLALLALAACGTSPSGGTPTPALEAIYTAAAQTVAAVLTQSAPLVTPTPPSTPTSPAPTPTAAAGVGAGVEGPPPSPTTTPPADAPCNQAAFVTDVTLPDGTEVLPGTKVTKTWRLRNTGSCAWTPDYALIFVQGALMDAPLAVPLETVVFPGEEADLSVPLVAPTEPGTYRGYWKLRTPGGEVFGVEPDGASFWVEIRVVPPTPTP